MTARKVDYDALVRYVKTHTHEQTAEMFNINRGEVYRILKRLGKLPGRRQVLDREAVVDALLRGESSVVVGDRYNINPRYIARVYKEFTGESIVELRLRQDRVKGQPVPQVQTQPPLTPAMRHLAQFDSILAARLERENNAL